MGNLWNEGIARVRVRQERQNAEEHLGDTEGGAPLGLQNIKADTAGCVDIRMIDLGLEGDNRGLERVVRGEVDAQTEDTAVKGGIGGSEDHCVPAEEVITDRTCCAVLDRGRLNLREFALKSTKGHRTRLRGVEDTGCQLLRGRGDDTECSQQNNK